MTFLRREEATKAQAKSPDPVGLLLGDAAATRAGTRRRGVPQGSFSDKKNKKSPTGDVLANWRRRSDARQYLVDKGCVRAIKVNDWHWSGCTECGKDKHGTHTGLTIMRMSDMTGRCVPYKEMMYQRCAGLSSSDGGAAGATYSASVCGTQNCVCTKLGEVKTLVRFDTGTNAVKNHFKKVLTDLPHDWKKPSVAYCRVRKETICKASACTVTKQVGCVKVCKVKALSPLSGKDCRTDLCAGDNGRIACRSIAAMA